MSILSLLADLVISGLLVATIVYAVILNNRLAALRSNKEELAKLITEFNDATVRAEASIPRLKKAAEEARQSLQDRVEKAQALKDDLSFMIERGDSMANRLESSVRLARGETRPAPKARETASVNPAARPKPAMEDEGTTLFGDDLAQRSDAERELLRALQSAR